MRPLIGRLARPRNEIHHVRRDIIMHLRPRGLAEPFSRFCRTYGFVDQGTDTIRGSEAGRFLLFVFLFRNASNRIAATVDAAVRANKPMIVGATFKRLQMMFRTTAGGAPYRGRSLSNEERGKLRIVMDDWLYRVLQNYEMQYRKADGLVDDTRLITDIMRSAIQDPQIPTIAAYYTRRVEPLREKMRQIEAFAAPLLKSAIGDEAQIGRLARVG